MTTGYYQKVIDGRLYPVAARTDPLMAYCVEVERGTKSKHIGIRKAPKGSSIERRLEK